MYKKKFITILVISFNLSQSFNNTPYLFYKNGSNQRSILSVYGPRRPQMQGGKNWILPKEINQTVLLRLSLAGDLEKPLMSLHGIEWREHGNGLWANIQRQGFI
jgi:hypothetical protein